MSKLTENEIVKYADIKYYKDAFDIAWGINNIGFGHFLFENDKDGNVIIDNEAMDKDTIKKVMNFIIDNAKFKGE